MVSVELLSFFFGQLEGVNHVVERCFVPGWLRGVLNLPPRPPCIECEPEPKPELEPEPEPESSIYVGIIMPSRFGWVTN